jgi:hypothetical protein
MHSWPRRATPLALLTLALLLALLLALPGRTEVVKYVNDLLIFLDGAYRIAEGQVPNRDFHTALGPLAYYIPGIAFMLTGSLGAAMPTGTALVILLVAPSTVHVLASRFHPAIAIPLGAVLLLILAAPFNLGEPVTALSFGMFYNRIGWAVLALLLTMYIAPRKPARRQILFDALSAALFVLLLVYLKISYGAVALVFLVLMLVLSPQRRWAAVALAIVGTAAILIELVWGGTAAHIADLRLAAEVSGGLRGTIEDRVRLALINLADILIFTVLAGFALWRTRSFRDLLFYGFCAASGYAVLNQNFQGWGMITLFAGAAVAAERLVRADANTGDQKLRHAGLAAWLLLLAFLLPTLVTCGLALGLHTVLAARGAGDDFALPNFEGVRLVNVWSPSDHFFSSNYINSLRNGAAALAEFAPGEGGVFVLDFVSPFSAGLGLQPPEGDSSWQHIGRTFNDQVFLPPEELFSGVRIIMDPKYPVERFTTDGLRRAYLPYIQQNFDLIGENVDWWVYRAKTG